MLYPWYKTRTKELGNWAFAEVREKLAQQNSSGTDWEVVLLVEQIAASITELEKKGYSLIGMQGCGKDTMLLTFWKTNAGKCPLVPIGKSLDLDVG